MFYRIDREARTVTLSLHVQPNARENRVVGPFGDALKVKIAAPALDNRANAALVRFLAGEFGVPSARVAIRRGLGSRNKLVEISVPDAGAARLLQSWEALC